MRGFPDVEVVVLVPLWVVLGRKMMGLPVVVTITKYLECFLHVLCIFVLYALQGVTPFLGGPGLFGKSPSKGLSHTL
jgi:hypothetical protein